MASQSQIAGGQARVRDQISNRFFAGGRRCAVTTDRWSIECFESAPSHFVSLGDGFYGALFAGEIWINPPPKYAARLFPAAQTHERPAIIGPYGTAFFELKLFELLCPARRKEFRQWRNFIISKLYSAGVKASGKN
jgi:hypothetical protein